MKLSDSIKQYNFMRSEALDIGNRFLQLSRNSKPPVLPSRLIGRIDSFEDVEFNDDNFECSSEYNDACNCHPEYHTFSMQFPISLLDEPYENRDIAIMNFIEGKKCKELERLKAEAQKENQRKQKELQDQKDKELKEYKRLSKIYGDNHGID